MGPAGLVFAIERFAVHDGPGIRVAVFLKGCPLRCWWCHSPESQSLQPELLVKDDRCLVCGSCVPVCPHGAIAESDAGYDTTRARCDACGECAEACPADARTIAGRWLEVPDLIAQIERDRVFLDVSGGGVTFSGGEPLMQPEFLAVAIDTCRQAGLHTAVETCGFGSRRAIDVAGRADLVLFDLKLHDADRHRLATGVSNRIIVDNFIRLTSHHRAVRVRLPLIPGINDDAANLEAIGAFAAVHGAAGIDLLPYHTAGAAKYGRLDRPYPLEGLTAPTPDAIGTATQALAAGGLAVHLGG